LFGNYIYSVFKIAADDFGNNMLNLVSIHAVMQDSMEELVKTLEDVRAHINAEEDWDTADWEILRSELEASIGKNDDCYKKSA